MASISGRAPFVELTTNPPNQSWTKRRSALRHSLFECLGLQHRATRPFPSLLVRAVLGQVPQLWMHRLHFQSGRSEKWAVCLSNCECQNTSLLCAALLQSLRLSEYENFRHTEVATPLVVASAQSGFTGLPCTGAPRSGLHRQLPRLRRDGEIVRDRWPEFYAGGGGSGGREGPGRSPAPYSSPSRALKRERAPAPRSGGGWVWASQVRCLAHPHPPHRSRDGCPPSPASKRGRGRFYLGVSREVRVPLSRGILLRRAGLEGEGVDGAFQFLGQDLVDQALALKAAEAGEAGGDDLDVQMGLALGPGAVMAGMALRIVDDREP